MEASKQSVYEFWNEASCGEKAGLAAPTFESYQAHSAWRYSLEPRILEFVPFQAYAGKKVLEIGVGLGSDHQKFAEAGAVLTGIDLTERAVDHTRRRLDLFGLKSDLRVADCENLPFADDQFDLVYSWGVLHHTSDTARGVDEVYRVLKPGGNARIMIYHRYSMVGCMLWIRYALLRLRPSEGLTQIYARYLESPGTKAFTVREIKHMFRRFKDCRVDISLGCADLLRSHVGQRHGGVILRLAKAVWPRWFLRQFLSGLGLNMTIVATK